jgi:hypothetical protein
MIATRHPSEIEIHHRRARLRTAQLSQGLVHWRDLLAPVDVDDQDGEVRPGPEEVLAALAVGDGHDVLIAEGHQAGVETALEVPQVVTTRIPRCEVSRARSYFARRTYRACCGGRGRSNSCAGLTAMSLPSSVLMVTGEGSTHRQCRRARRDHRLVEPPLTA